MTDQPQTPLETITDPTILAQRQAAQTVQDCAQKLGARVQLNELLPSFDIITADGMSAAAVSRVLATQAYTLDAAYNRVLQEGVQRDWFDTTAVNAALKAQRQFCLTVQALERLETRLSAEKSPDYSTSENSNETNG